MEQLRQTNWSSFGERIGATKAFSSEGGFGDGVFSSEGVLYRRRIGADTLLWGFLPSRLVYDNHWPVQGMNDIFPKLHELLQIF